MTNTKYTLESLTSAIAYIEVGQHWEATPDVWVDRFFYGYVITVINGMLVAEVYQGESAEGAAKAALTFIK